MDKKVSSKSRVTRQDLANPFKMSLEEKRINAQSINLKDNFYIEDLGNGYSRIFPIDNNKRFGNK
jgi:hypothetical protein